MFTLECQRKWWKPEPGVLGWWIGFWAIVGSVGFLCVMAFFYVFFWPSFFFPSMLLTPVVVYAGRDWYRASNTNAQTNRWIGCIGAASYDVAWGEYQADLGTIWGSSAYLISSLLQWYESLDES